MRGTPEGHDAKHVGVDRFHFKHIYFLHCSVNSFRFLDFLLWFVLGPGRPPEAPGRPTDGSGGPPGVPRTPPGPGQKT